MKKKILIVEYDSPTIDNLKEILSAKIFDLSIAAEGDIAKKLIKKRKFDLIISAAMLPKFHGFELSKFSKKVQPDTSVIIISGVYKGSDYRNQAISEYKADEFIEKPLDYKKFLKTVLDILGIGMNELTNNQDPGSTQIPAFDTKKIKTQTSETENSDDKLSSEDIFGDLIEDVENIPAHNIDLDEEATLSGNDPESGQDSSKDSSKVEIKKNINSDKEKNKAEWKKQPVDEMKFDLDNLIKPESVKRDHKVEKEIENDIMKKFEETLSGLGLKDTLPGKNKATLKDKKNDKDQTSIEIKTVEPSETREKIKDKASIEGYEIQGLIARGGMAEIFKAKKMGAQGFEKTLALKKILSGYGADDKYIEMFVDEAKIAAELSHPNIVQIYDFGKKDNYYFIAMEYVEGKDLRLILRKLAESKKTLDEHISIYICLKILEALSYAHSAKDKYGNSLDIVHRDVSPPNILVSYNGEIKLTDFGVSKASNKLHQTLSGALKGKLLYMSPEQAKAEKDIDGRSDIYSVGVILFELLTGNKLFKGHSEMEVLKLVQDGSITKPSEINPGIDPELETIILKALNRDKTKRYSEASEMAKDLEAYLYKNYNHIPTPIHINVKIYELFKSEIIKDGIGINPKQIPFEIVRIKTSEQTELIDIEETGTHGETEIIEEKSTVESESDLNPENKTGDQLKKSGSDQEEESVEEPVNKEIEITDQPEPVLQEEKDLSTEESFPSSEMDDERIDPDSEQKGSDLLETAIPDSINIERFTKKKGVRPVFLVIFIIIAVTAGVYFLMNRSGNLKVSKQPEKRKIISKVKTSEEKKSGDEILTNKVENSGGPGSENQGGLNGNENKISDSSDLANIIKNSGAKKSSELTNKDNVLLNDQKALDEKTKLEKEKEIKKKKDDEKKRRAAIEKKKREKEAEQKRIEDEARKKKEEEDRQKKIEEEKIRLQKEAEQKKIEDEKRKKLLDEKNRVKPGQIYPLSEVDSKPQPVSTPAPVLSRRMRIGTKTTVLISFLIDDKGNIEKLKLIRKTSNSSINSAILKAIQKWKYKPAVKDGVRVKVWKTIPLTLK